MVEYVKGTKDDKEEVVDFINYVFSQSRCPHDFKSIVPKVYSDDVDGLGAIHYLAKKDGRIKAAVANRVIDISVGGEIIKAGLVGSVSVHPYSRGEGYMKKLMTEMISEARDMGIDIMILGGQRQRYGYFGFENAGTNLKYTVTKTNIRHCLKDVDFNKITFKPISCADEDERNGMQKLYESLSYHAKRDKKEYVNIMKNWNRECLLIYKDGEFQGYSYDGFGEVVLKNEEDFKLVLPALFKRNNIDKTDIYLQPFNKERCALLSEICEICEIVPFEMINVLNWKKVLKAYLEFKASYEKLEDGKQEIKIDDEKLEISVTSGKVLVEEKKALSKDAISFTHNMAERVFFSPETYLFKEPKLKNWAPLPFAIDGPDQF